MANQDLAYQILIAATDLASPQLEKVGVSTDELNRRLDALRDPMAAVGAATERFTDRLAASAAPIAAAGRNILTLTGALSGIGALLGGVAYESAKKFETAQLSLQKVLDDSDGPVGQYTDAIRGLGLEYGQNASVLTEAAATFKQAGFSASEAVGLVKNALDLMIAGDLEAARASELLTSSLKGFSQPASEATRLVDVLNEVSNKYATNVNELATGMADLSPIASQMGLSFEETAGILTPIIEVFRSGSEAADGLKTGLLKLVDDAKPVREALAEIGVAQTDMNGALRPGKDILLDVARAFQTLDENQKLAITSQIVGIDQAGRMVKVFDNLAKTSEITATALAASGSAAKEVEIRLKSAESVANQTAEAFRQAAAVLGTQYRDAVTGVVDATGDLARAFTQATEAGSLDKLIAAVRPQLQAVERLFRETAAALPEALARVDFSRFAAAIADVSGVAAESFRALFGSIDITTVDGLTRALQLASDALAAAVEFSAGFVEELEPLFAVLGQVARAVVESTDGIARFAGEISGMAQVVSTAGPIIGDLANGLFSMIGTIAEVTFKIGLLVLGIKGLNAIGISTIPVLGRLAAAIGGLSVGTAGMAAALAGVPGLLAGVTAAAGAAGYGLGTLLHDGITAVTGQDLGGWVYDAVQAIKGLVSPAEAAAAGLSDMELATLQAAAALRRAEEAARKQREEQEKLHRSNQDIIDQFEEQQRTTDLLTKTFADLGLAWDQATGRLVPLNAALRDQVEASDTVRHALDVLGLDYAKLANKVTADGQKIIEAFGRITGDLTANAQIVQAALTAALDSAETEIELAELERLYREWAANAGRSVEQVEQDLERLRQKSAELREETDALSKALSNLGLKGPKELQEAADKAKASLDTVIAAAKEGKVGAELVKEAFAKWAAAARDVAEASGKPIDPLVKATAATLGLTEELGNLTKASEATAKAADTQVRAHTRQAASLDKLTEKQRKALEEEKKAADEAEALKWAAKIPSAIMTSTLPVNKTR